MNYCPLCGMTRSHWFGCSPAGRARARQGKYNTATLDEIIRTITTQPTNGKTP